MGTRKNSTSSGKPSMNIIYLKINSLSKLDASKALALFGLALHFNEIYIDILTVILYKFLMRDAKFFTNPPHEWQKRYEALRASFVERLPARIVAERFGYSTAYVHLLRHLFTHEKLDFSEPVPEGKAARRRVNAQLRGKIRSFREQRLSAGEIAQLLSEEGIEISVRTIERVLAEEGFKKLPRRTRIKLGITVKGAQIPERSQVIVLSQLEGKTFESDSAGVFLFAPFIDRFNIEQMVKTAGLPGSKTIPATSYFLSFLALKLLGTERYSHVGDHGFDQGLGLFAGLNRLPKCWAMSTYSYSLDEVHLLRVQQAFVKDAQKLGLYEGSVVNLDFHTVPHFGEHSVLEKHWAGARNKRMKGALTLFAQDAESKLILYTASDIKRDEADEQVLSFLSYWQRIQRGVKPTFVFDSKFTTYQKLSELNAHQVKFITLRRRGKKLLDRVEDLSPWNQIHIPHAKRKYPNPLVHDSTIVLGGYDGDLRQIVVRGNGREKPSFLITNDFDSPIELLVGNYARRWRVENTISEAVKFFHLNALSSPILVKVHFDVIMTMIADTLYTMLAKKLRGFEYCDAPKINRHFLQGKGTIQVRNGEIGITFPRRSHNPILRGVPWDSLPHAPRWFQGYQLSFNFK